VRSFLVEIYAPATGAIAAIERRILAASTELTQAGTPVRYVRSIFVPEDEICLYLFEADTSDSVREATVRAGISALRIVEALERTCEPVRRTTRKPVR
jgi:hypothetical protein